MATDYSLWYPVGSAERFYLENKSGGWLLKVRG
jgi:hypothetical protein